MRSALGATARTLLLATALGLAALPARAETLADALIAAYRNSNLIEQNRALLRAADEDVAHGVLRLSTHRGTTIATDELLALERVQSFLSVPR